MTSTLELNYSYSGLDTDKLFNVIKYLSDKDKLKEENVKLIKISNALKNIITQINEDKESIKEINDNIIEKIFSLGLENSFKDEIEKSKILEEEQKKKMLNGLSDDEIENKDSQSDSED